MSEFFKGWRRKAGCATLVMACVFAAGWVRTIDSAYQCVYVTPPCFPFNENQILHSLSLTQDGIEWASEKAGAWKDYKLWLIPHRSIAIALTLLSAHLLLSKPRVAKPARPTEQKVASQDMPKVVR